MRSRHQPWLVTVVVCGVLGGTRLLSAQEVSPAPEESAPPVAAPTEAAKPPVDAPVPATEAKAEVEPAASDEKAATPPSKAVGATPGRFEPTEKVRADFDVSFPIDI
jgi:hypothetical protein